MCRTNVAVVPRVTETIVDYDESGRTLTYRAADGMPRFIAQARNRWQVTALTDTRTLVAFSGQVEVRGLLGALARWWLLVRVARTGRYLLDDLKHYIERGAPSPRKRGQLRRRLDPVVGVGAWPTTRRLRAALRANAVFSLVSGSAPVAAGWSFAGPWGVPVTAPALIGGATAAFGALVARLAVQPIGPLRRWAIGVVGADLAWVAASVGLLIWYPLTVAGAVAVAATAVIVTDLAVWQLAGIATARVDDPMADVEVVEAARAMKAPPADVWSRVTDHELYGRLAPNLSTVEVISEAGQPLRRRCTDTAGRGWQETCTLWEEGRRYAVDVDTSDYPYPLQHMRGLWQVDPDGAGGSRVTMRFVYRARPSLFGGLFAIGFRALFPPVLHRIFLGWRRSLAPAAVARR